MKSHKASHMTETIKDRLADKGIIHFYKEVNNESVSEIINFILEKNITPGKLEHLTILVSSWGGSLYAAFALTDIMEGSVLPIHTVGLGMIASAGLLIFMSGNKGNRILTPNTEILSHQYSAVEHGKEHELIAARRGNELTSKRIIAHCVKHTGMNPEDVRALLLPPSDIYLSAQDAKEYGICDDIKFQP